MTSWGSWDQWFLRRRSLTRQSACLTHTHAASQPYSISLLWCCWTTWLLMWVFGCDGHASCMIMFKCASERWWIPLLNMAEYILHSRPWGRGVRWVVWPWSWHTFSHSAFLSARYITLTVSIHDSTKDGANVRKLLLLNCFLILLKHDLHDFSCCIWACPQRSSWCRLVSAYLSQVLDVW